MSVHPLHVEASWLKRCIVSDTGKPVPVVANALEALRGDPAVQDALAFDEMLRAPMLMHEIGNPFSVPTPFEPRPLTDNDVIDFQRWMQRAGLNRISKE